MGERNADAEQADWQPLVAVGAVAGDLSVDGIVRYAEVDRQFAEQALEAAAAAGVLAGERQDPAALSRLVADLPLERVAEVHAAAARHLLAEGPDRLVDAVEHARAAGLPLDEIVSMADRGGRMSLVLGDYTSAHQLLSLAADVDASDDLSHHGRRLCDLAEAARGQGDGDEAKRLLMQAAQMGEMARDPALVARAAVAYSDWPDWNDGDPQAAGLLHRAEAMDLTHDDRVAVRAVRASTEMRIPLVDEQTHQVSWVTRPTVAQPLADEALADSAACAPEVRLQALLAWRSTHRAPTFLDRRRETSTEALDLAQRLRRPRQQVEAATWLAVDALESADRPLFDETLAVARWVAARDGNPTIEWQSLTLACGAAHLDGDLDHAVALARRAREVGERHAIPGWFGFDLVMATQVVDDRDLLDELEAFLVDDEDYPVMTNPFARALVARFFMRHERADVAERFVRRAYRQLETEAAYLLLCTRLAMVAAPLGLHDLCRELLDHLSPWADHVAIDSHGWFCGGPVGVPIAMLHRALGNERLALSCLAQAEPLARALNDVRSTSRISALRQELSDDSDEGPPPLTSRELAVLRRIAQGETNRQIAEHLTYSVSTIRMDTMSIYRKLNVAGRADAAARAVELGLL